MFLINFSAMILNKMTGKRVWRSIHLICAVQVQKSNFVPFPDAHPYLRNASRTNKTSSSGIVREAQREANTEKSEEKSQMVWRDAVLEHSSRRFSSPLSERGKGFKKLNKLEKYRN